MTLTLTSMLALALAIFVMTATPGPGILAVVSRGLAHGLRPTLIFGAGLILGDLVYLALVLGGLGILAREVGWVFLAVRWAGAACLIWMGLKCIFRPGPRPARLGSAPGGRRNFFTGLALTLGNPKVMTFYCGFLPTFMDMSSLTVKDGLAVAAIAGGVAYLIVAVYARLASGGRRLLATDRAWKRANRCAGAVMAGAGVAVAAE